MKYSERTVENKKLLWFEDSNKYCLLEIPAYKVVKKISEGDAPEKIARWCSQYYNLPQIESERFVAEIQQVIREQSAIDENQPGLVLNELATAIPTLFVSLRHYYINGCRYSVAYQNEKLEHLIHPKFAHLEISEITECNFYFQIFEQLDKYVLWADGKIIGQWLKEDAHYFTGKFSMELLNRMYTKLESEWMGVFHASAISNGSRAVLFLGDSGNGKSTLSAILMASGFDLLADDFVPVDAVTGEVLYFPAAVSVKKTAIDELLPLFPQLETAAEFYYPGLDKTVRYLAPLRHLASPGTHFPCNVLVFVKYERGSGMKLKKLKKDKAFELLVPDSWISPLPENAARFMDWFLEMHCYQLTYSNNKKMVASIGELFRDDL